MGYDLVITGTEFGEAELKVAPDYPDTHFVCTPMGGLEASNLASLDLREQENSYLCGILAGLMTKTNTLGTFVGMDYPVTVRCSEAYKIGAREVNSKVKIYDAMTGSWTDPAKGKEISLTMIDNDCDVIMHYADLCGFGLYEACKERSTPEKTIYAIGECVDQNELAPDNILTSHLFDAAFCYEKAVEMVVAGTFKGGSYVWGMSDGATNVLAPFHGLVPEDIAATVQRYADDITAGKITVPEIGTSSGNWLD